MSAKGEFGSRTRNYPQFFSLIPHSFITMGLLLCVVGLLGGDIVVGLILPGVHCKGSLMPPL